MNSLAIAAAIVVSVASSLTDVLAELGKRYEALTNARVHINAGASNTLARQIVEGAPVDLFISADEVQMDLVAAAGRIAPGSRTALLSNQLVVIAPVASGIRIEAAGDLAAAHIARVALANPDAVPAGVYARTWLERLGLWQRVGAKAVPLPTVRAALAAVREGRADTGIVYATDARTEPGVRVVFTPPAGEVGKIVYPAAVITGSNSAAAAQFLKFLQSAEAKKVFEAAGFQTAAGF